MKMDQEAKSDSELLAKYAIHNDQKAFELLVSRHCQLVQGVAKRTLGEHHEAQDVTQATFLLLAKNAHKLKSNKSLAPWLYTAARRLALNSIRSEKRRQQREQQSISHVASMPQHETTNTQDIRTEIDAAITKIPEKYRTPLILFHLQEQPLKKISQTLKLNENTLRTRVARGRDLLRKHLLKRGFEFSALATITQILSSEANAHPVTPAFQKQLCAVGKNDPPTINPDILNLTSSVSSSATNSLTSTKALCIIALTLLVTGALITFSKERSPSKPSHSKSSNQPAFITFKEKNTQPTKGANQKTLTTQKLINELRNFVREKDQALIEFYTNKNGKIGLFHPRGRKDLKQATAGVTSKIANLAYQLGQLENENSLIILGQIFDSSLPQAAEIDRSRTFKTALFGSALGGWLSKQPNRAFTAAQKNFTSHNFGFFGWRGEGEKKNGEVLARLPSRKFEDNTTFAAQITRGIMAGKPEISSQSIYPLTIGLMDFMGNPPITSNPSREKKIIEILRKDPSLLFFAISNTIESNLGSMQSMQTISMFLGGFLDSRDPSPDQYLELINDIIFLGTPSLDSEPKLSRIPQPLSHPIFYHWVSKEPLDEPARWLNEQLRKPGGNHNELPARKIEFDSILSNLKQNRTLSDIQAWKKQNPNFRVE